MPPIYVMQLPYGPPPLRGDGAAWQAEMGAWLALSFGLLAIGVILTIWTARRVLAPAARRLLTRTKVDRR